MSEEDVVEIDEAVLADGLGLINPDTQRDGSARARKALHEAVAGLYFADSADYARALRSVIRALDPSIAKLFGEDEKKAYEKTLEAAEAAAPRQGTVDVSRSFLRSLIDEIVSADFVDDHSVGLCACGVASTIGSLTWALEGYRVCPKCGGDPLDYENESATCSECDNTGRTKIRP